MIQLSQVYLDQCAWGDGCYGVPGLLVVALETASGNGAQVAMPLCARHAGEVGDAIQAARHVPDLESWSSVGQHRIRELAVAVATFAVLEIGGDTELIAGGSQWVPPAEAAL